MSTLMISCRKASELVEKNNFEPLSFSDKMKLKIHTHICKTCTAYGQQSQLLEQLLNEHFGEHSSKYVNQANNEELKTKIISEIEHAS
ncbi:MAG: hypothetical protein R2852_09470 [Bacteroidia bacterium]